MSLLRSYKSRLVFCSARLSLEAFACDCFCCTRSTETNHEFVTLACSATALNVVASLEILCSCWANWNRHVTKCVHFYTWIVFHVFFIFICNEYFCISMQMAEGMLWCLRLPFRCFCNFATAVANMYEAHDEHFDKIPSWQFLILETPNLFAWSIFRANQPWVRVLKLINLQIITCAWNVFESNSEGLWVLPVQQSNKAQMAAWIICAGVCLTAMKFCPNGQLHQLESFESETCAVWTLRRTSRRNGRPAGRPADRPIHPPPLLPCKKRIEFFSLQLI